jgi:hypothetical protein
MAAAVTAEVFAGFSGPLGFVLHLGMTGRYIDAGTKRRAA